MPKLRLLALLVLATSARALLPLRAPKSSLRTKTPGRLARPAHALRAAVGDDARDAAARVLDELTSAGPADEVLGPFCLDSKVMWRQWRGTVLEATWRPALLNMVLSLAIIAAVRWWLSCEAVVGWAFFMTPDEGNPLIARLKPVEAMFSYQMTLLTFVLAFLTGQALAFWERVYMLAR
eukprot:5511629-Prymnesium_polylepis.1